MDKTQFTFITEEPLLIREPSIRSRTRGEVSHLLREMMIHTHIFYGQNISSNFLGRVSCRSLVSRALWSWESCGLKMILSEWRNCSILRHGCSTINQYNQTYWDFLQGCLKKFNIEHKLFSVRSSNLLHKDGKRSLVMFLCLQLWVQILYSIRGCQYLNLL